MMSVKLCQRGCSQILLIAISAHMWSPAVRSKSRPSEEPNKKPDDLQRLSVHAENKSLVGHETHIMTDKYLFIPE